MDSITAMTESSFARAQSRQMGQPPTQHVKGRVSETGLGPANSCRCLHVDGDLGLLVLGQRVLCGLLSLGCLCLCTDLLSLGGLGLRSLCVLLGQPLQVPRVAPVQERVAHEAQHPREEGDQHQGHAQGLRVRCVPMAVDLHAGEVVSEDALGQQADHRVAEDLGARALQGALPSHDGGATVILHDLGQDREVHADAAPSGGEPQDDHQHEVVGEGTALRRLRHEDEPSHRDAREHADLCRDGTAVVPAEARQGVAHAPSDHAAHRARDLGGDVDNGCLPILDAAKLKEQGLVAERIPRNRAEAALQDEHAEGRHPEVLAELPDLSPEGVSTALLLLDDHLRGLDHEGQSDKANDHRQDADNDEGDAPTLEAHDGLPRKVRADECAAHRTNIHGDVHGAIDLAAVRLHSGVGHNSVGNGPQRSQEEAIESTQNEHDPEAINTRQNHSDEALDKAADDDDGLPLHDAAVGEDTPHRCGDITGEALNHAHQCQVVQRQPQVFLQGDQRAGQQHGVSALQAANQAEQGHEAKARTRGFDVLVSRPIVRLGHLLVVVLFGDAHNLLVVGRRLGALGRVHDDCDGGLLGGRHVAWAKEQLEEAEIK
mmetsp:Transcript_25659/g.65450  ORF Transcript_25659/g.65450 Transcript_25659/m.65450 type:complete len:601 (-) Transcript_25659:7-1809(-)